MAEKEKNLRKMTTLELIEAAKDFSFEQKLNVVQSVVQLIPREQQQPWNLSKGGWEKYQAKLVKKVSETESKSKGESTTNTVDNQEQAAKNVTGEPTSSRSEMPGLKQPPLLDPYEKSMRYYEKHLVLNKFQHMTANLVLHRPDDALQYMVDWCKEVQIQTKSEATKIKMLYEGATRDSDDELESEPPKPVLKPDTEISDKFGNEQLSLAGFHKPQDVKRKPEVEVGQGDQSVTSQNELAPSNQQVGSVNQVGQHTETQDFFSERDSSNPQPPSSDQVITNEQSLTDKGIIQEVSNTVMPPTPIVEQDVTLLSDDAEVTVSEADELEDTLSAISSENSSVLGSST